MNNRSMLVFFLVAGCMLSSVARSTSTFDRNVEEIFKSSEYVAEGQVSEIIADCKQEKSCHLGLYSLSIDVSKNVKGDSKGLLDRSGSICSKVPLEVGFSYIIFLRAAVSKEERFSSSCKFVLDRDSAFQRRGRHVYRVGSPDASVVVDYLGRKYMTSAVAEDTFDQCVDALVEAKGNENVACRPSAPERKVP